MRIRPKFVSVNVSTARGAAERWRESYFGGHGDKWRQGTLSCGKTAEEIYDLLCLLGPDPAREDVAKIIGNKSWSYLSCDGCNEQVVYTVSIGEYEPKQYCKTCLSEALAVLSEVSG